MSADIVRRFARALRPTIAGALGLCFALSASGAYAQRDFSSWFKFGEEVRQSWTVTEVAGDPMRVAIRPLFTTSPTYRVMVFYPRPSSAYDTAITRILQVFAEKEIDAEFSIVNFNNEDARGDRAIAAADRGRYDLIFGMGSESTAWLYSRYRGRSIPVVSVCSKDPVELGQIRDYESGSGTNIAFTSLNMPIDVQMAYLLELRPTLRNIAILVDGKNVSAMQTQAQPMARHARELGLRVLDLVVQDPNNAQRELRDLVANAVRAMKKNDPALAHSVFWITGSTAVFREIKAINENADRVPVLSAVPEVVRPGDDSAVLSVGVSFESNAHLAAIYGADVLLGRVRVGDLKVGIVSPPDIAINIRKARQIELPIPFSFFESASYVFDYDGRPARAAGRAPGNGG